MKCVILKDIHSNHVHNFKMCDNLRPYYQIEIEAVSIYGHITR